MAESCGSFSTACGENFDRSGDDRQDIVEVMGDAAGELADGFHFFGLPNAVLCRDLVREVADESVENKALPRFQRGDAQLGPEFLSVAPPGHDFAAASENFVLPGAQEAFQGCLELIAVRAGENQIEQVLPERFLARPAEDRLGLRIPVEDAAALVALEKRIDARYR